MGRSSIFEGRRIIFEIQNRPQEAPREEKQRLGRRSNEKSREEEQQEQRRGTQDGPLAPEKTPRDPQNAFKTTFGSKTSIFQKSSCRVGGSSIFDDRRVIFETPNRPQEAPREEKQRLRRRSNEKRRRRTTLASKRSPIWFFGSREAPKRFPRAP